MSDFMRLDSAAPTGTWLLWELLDTCAIAKTLHPAQRLFVSVSTTLQSITRMASSHR